MVREGNFFENLGLLARADSELLGPIQGFLGSLVVTRYRYWKLAIRGYRDLDVTWARDAGDPLPTHDGAVAFSEFEWLARTMAERIGLPDPGPVTAQA
jgi:hypothetical protein